MPKILFKKWFQKLRKWILIYHWKSIYCIVTLLFSWGKNRLNQMSVERNTISIRAASYKKWYKILKPRFPFDRNVLDRGLQRNLNYQILDFYIGKIWSKIVEYLWVLWPSWEYFLNYACHPGHPFNRFEGYLDIYFVNFRDFFFESFAHLLLSTH